MDLIQTLLKRLEATQGDTHAQATLTAEFMLMTRPEAERESLRAALDAAAVLRWFDADLLAKMLEISAEEASKQFEVIKFLPFVERYRRGERDLWNIHESTRLGWRKQLAFERSPYFRSLSVRAASCFADDFTPAGRIEWIYHLLCGDPERGATELENSDRDWSNQAHPEHRYALATTLQELDETRLIEGRARAWSLLVIAWARDEREETAQLVVTASEILELARATADQSAEAGAQCLCGDISLAQGDLKRAQAAFAQYLAISQRLAEQDPSNAGWQRDLAVAHSRMGDVLQAQGDLKGAQAAFAEALTVLRQLTEQDPSNAEW